MKWTGNDGKTICDHHPHDDADDKAKVPTQSMALRRKAQMS